MDNSGVERLYRAGAISALAVGLSYIAIIALYIPIGAPPIGVEPRLAYLAAHTGAWWAILGLSVVTDFLFIPVALSLYSALKRFSGTVMLMATACVALFVFLDLAITWTNYAALISLSGKYATAANDAQRAAVLAAANYATAVLESRLLFVYNTLTLAVGILLTGFAMLQQKGAGKSIFRKGTAYLGLLTGVLGIVSVFGPVFVTALNATIIATSILTTVWLFFVAYELYKFPCNRALLSSDISTSSLNRASNG